MYAREKGVARLVRLKHYAGHIDRTIESSARWNGMYYLLVEAPFHGRRLSDYEHMAYELDFHASSLPANESAVFLQGWLATRREELEQQKGRSQDMSRVSTTSASSH